MTRWPAQEIDQGLPQAIDLPTPRKPGPWNYMLHAPGVPGTLFHI